MARRPFAPARKRYDPEKEGYGSPDDWARAFNVTMGFEEAKRRVRESKRTEWQILGVEEGATWAEVQRAYRARIIEVHPDRAKIHGLTAEESHEKMKELNAAYVVLKAEFGK